MQKLGVKGLEFYSVGTGKSLKTTKQERTIR